MKTVFLTESQLNDIVPSVVGTKTNIHTSELEINNQIVNDIQNYTTFFGDCLKSNEVNGESWIEKIVRPTFDGLMHNKSMNGINTINDVEKRLSHLISKCVTIEKPIREQLEKACFNYVINLFGVPDDFLMINIELCDDITINDENISVDPIDGDNFGYDNDGELQDEVNKRKLLLALCIGCGMCFSRDTKNYCQDLPVDCDELSKLYHEILILNTILLFLKNENSINDKDKKQIGCSLVKLGNSENKTQIIVQAKIFPVLLSETISALMELFISHGLPQNKKVSKLIVNKTSFIKAEPWMMRVGPRLWSLFSGGFDDIDASVIPYLMRNLSMTNYDNFEKLIIGSVYKNNDWRRAMKNLSHKSKKDSDYFKFVDKMSSMQSDKGIIMDDYIHPDEL